MKLAASKLREKYSGDKNAVASVFLRPHLNAALTSLVLGEVLRSIWVQLSPKHRDCKSEHWPSDELQNQSFQQAELDSLREGLVELIESLDNAFLIIDGLDWCDAEGLQDTTLESNLSILQEAGLRIMASTRGLCVLPTNEIYLGNETYKCDGRPDCGQTTPGLFWICTFHHDFGLCFNCRNEGWYCTQW